MTFLNFSQFSESVFRLNFSRKHFSENQTKFFFDWKIFFVDQFFLMTKTKNFKNNFYKLLFKNQTQQVKLTEREWKRATHDTV